MSDQQAQDQPRVYRPGSEPPLYLVIAPHQEKKITSPNGRYDFLYADYSGGEGETGYTYTTNSRESILTTLDHHTQGVCCNIILPGPKPTAFRVNYTQGEIVKCTRDLPHEQDLPEVDSKDKPFQFDDGTTAYRLSSDPEHKRWQEIHFQFGEQMVDFHFENGSVEQRITMPSGYFEKVELLNGFVNFQSGHDKEVEKETGLNLRL